MSMSRDDLEDVLELSETLSCTIYEIVKEYDFHIAMSALLNSTVHCILDQCEDATQALTYRKILLTTFDRNLRTFKKD